MRSKHSAYAGANIPASNPLTADDLNAIRREIVEGVLAITADLARRGEDFPTQVKGGTEMTFSGRSYIVAYTYFSPEHVYHLEIGVDVDNGAGACIIHQEMFRPGVPDGFEVKLLPRPKKLPVHLVHVWMAISKSRDGSACVGGVQ
jgi:hypothetical protein